jgi:signal transduction histidine kinase
MLAIPLPLAGADPGVYLLVRLPHRPDPIEIFVWLGLVGLVLVLMSVPLARAISRPLEQITSFAQRLGQGDLRARTGIERADEAGVLARTMDEMAVQLEKRIQREKELLANVSHELRTPLSRVRLALELCGEPGVTLDEMENHLQGIAADAGELEQMIEEVLAVARLDPALAPTGASGFVVRSEPVPVTELIDAARSRLQKLHPLRNVILQGEPTGDLPLISGEPGLLVRLLTNLLDNAAKYSPAEEPVEISAQVSGDGKSLQLEVRDQGPGIAESDLERIFDPFFRAEQSRGKELDGIGLGLTLCLRIAEAHGGSLTAANRPENQGAVFRVKLPISR